MKWLKKSFSIVSNHIIAYGGKVFTSIITNKLKTSLLAAIPIFLLAINHYFNQIKSYIISYSLNSLANIIMVETIFIVVILSLFGLLFYKSKKLKSEIHSLKNPLSPTIQEFVGYLYDPSTLDIYCWKCHASWPIKNNKLILNINNYPKEEYIWLVCSHNRLHTTKYPRCWWELKNKNPSEFIRQLSKANLS